MTYTYDNSEHGNDDGKVNYVADNKMPQQIVFHGVVCCLHRCQIVICLWYVRQPTNLPQGWIINIPVIQEIPSLTPH